MSQHDLDIANQGFPNFRADLNNALQALGSVSAGATEPSTIYAYQLWLDTSTTPSTLKQRNGDNDAWVSLFYIDQSTDLMSLPDITGDLTLNNGDLIVSSGDFSVAQGSQIRLAGNQADEEAITSGATGRIDIEARGSIIIWTDTNNNASANEEVFAIHKGAIPGGSSTELFTMDEDGDATFQTGDLIVSSGFLNVGSASEVTINSSGAITATKTYHEVDTYSDASSDNLDTINGGSEGDILILKSVNNSRDTTIRDTAVSGGNISLDGGVQFVLSSTSDRIVLMYDGAYWQELSRANNN